MAVTAQEGVNSYLTVAAAELYFGGRLDADAWAATTPETKEAALITATRALDRHNFKGFKAGGTKQTLQFPRILSIWPTTDRPGWVGQYPYWFNTGTTAIIPPEVKDAVCEQAIFLLAMTKYQKARTKEQQLGIVTKQVGMAHEMSSELLVRMAQQNPPLSPEARQLIRNWLGVGVFIT